MPSEQAAAATPADAIDPPPRRRHETGIGRPLQAYVLFVLPYLVILLLFLVVPLLLGIALSFQDYDTLLGFNGWAGFDNFANLLHDRGFRGAVRNTLLFVVITVPAFVLLGLFLALALNNRLRRSAVLRTIFFASSVLSVSVVTLIWRIVYLPDRGIAGGVLRLLGAPSVQVLNSEALALPALAVVTLWWLIGLPIALFLAALQRVPADVYEAAALDNASRLRTLLFITLPSIRRSIVLVAAIEVVLQLQMFGQALLLTGGGPDNASRPIVQFIYQAGFRDQQLDVAAAASQVLLVLVAVAALAQMWLGRRRDGG
jgi:multiple sugar transport system permease protein